MLLIQPYYTSVLTDPVTIREQVALFRWVKNKRLRQGFVAASMHLMAFSALLQHALRSAFVEILFLIGYFAVLSFMSQGRDIVVGMFERDAIYEEFRFFYTINAVIQYSMCMWVIPSYLFLWRARINQAGVPNVPRNAAFSDHLFFLHRFLAMFPFWGLALIIHHNWVLVLSFSALIALFAVLSLQKPKRTYFYLIAPTTVLTSCWGLVNYYELFGATYDYFLAKILFSLLLLCLSYCFYCLYYQHDYDLSVRHHYKVNHYLYSFVLIANLVTLLILLHADYKRIAPESVMLFVLGLYVFVIDLVFYLISITRFFKVAAAVLALLVFLYFQTLGPNYDAYKVDLLSKTNQSYRLQPLEAHLNGFTSRLLQNYPSKGKLPIVLISGEGGGSRAGLWFLKVVMDMEKQAGQKLKDFTFALSTVSGSTIGAEALMAYWANKDLMMPNAPIDNYPREVFKNNFVSGGVFSLLLKDWWSAAGFIKSDASDRNTILYEQEAKSIHAALSLLNNYDKDSSFADVLSQNIKEGGLNYCLRDYMSFYYNNKGELRNQYPLFFINTCRSNDGRRGILSPTWLDSSQHVEAIDVSRYIYHDKVREIKEEKEVDGLKSNISLAAACNMSELFPFFSAPAYVERLGYFVDGGYHENSGLKTTSELYKQIVAYLDKKGLSEKFNIYILYLKNGGGNKEIYSNNYEISSPFLQPIYAVTNAPFTGHASYFEELMNERKDHFVQLSLNNKDLHTVACTKRSQLGRNGCVCIDKELLDDVTIKSKGGDVSYNFPLARMLSSTIIEKIIDNASYQVQKNPNLQKLLKTINHLQ